MQLRSPFCFESKPKVLFWITIIFASKRLRNVNLMTNGTLLTLYCPSGKFETILAECHNNLFLMHHPVLGSGGGSSGYLVASTQVCCWGRRFSFTLLSSTGPCFAWLLMVYYLFMQALHNFTRFFSLLGNLDVTRTKTQWRRLFDKSTSTLGFFLCY